MYLPQCSFTAQVALALVTVLLCATAAVARPAVTADAAVSEPSTATGPCLNNNRKEFDTMLSTLSEAQLALTTEQLVQLHACVAKFPGPFSLESAQGMPIQPALLPAYTVAMDIRAYPRHASKLLLAVNATSNHWFSQPALVVVASAAVDILRYHMLLSDAAVVGSEREETSSDLMTLYAGLLFQILDKQPLLAKMTSVDQARRDYTLWAAMMMMDPFVVARVASFAYVDMVRKMFPAQFNQTGTQHALMSHLVKLRAYETRDVALTALPLYGIVQYALSTVRTASYDEESYEARTRRQQKDPVWQKLLAAMGKPGNDTSGAEQASDTTTGTWTLSDRNTTVLAADSKKPVISDANQAAKAASKSTGAKPKPI